MMAYFHCQGVLVMWIVEGQWSTVRVVGADGGLFGHFSVHYLSLHAPSL